MESSAIYIWKSLDYMSQTIRDDVCHQLLHTLSQKVSNIRPQGSPLFPIFRALSRSLHRHSSVALRRCYTAQREAHSPDCYLWNFRETSPKHGTLQLGTEWTVCRCLRQFCCCMHRGRLLVCRAAPRNVIKKSLSSFTARLILKKILQTKRNKKEWTKSWFVRNKSSFATICKELTVN